MPVCYNGRRPDPFTRRLRYSFPEGNVTELLFLVDSYTREFQAHVTELVDDGVVLDRTAFYPGGGGQPGDTGVLVAGEQRFQVTRVGRKDDKIIHQIPVSLPQKGAEVLGILDWERRYLLMRTHTALHILCGVVWRDFGAKVTGGDMQPGSARMDFELDQMTSQFAEEVSEKINAEVKAARPVHVGNLTREEAEREPDLIRTKINLLPPAFGRFGPSIYPGWICRPMAEPTWPTPKRWGGSAWLATKAKAE